MLPGAKRHMRTRTMLTLVLAALMLLSLIPVSMATKTVSFPYNEESKLNSGLSAVWDKDPAQQPTQNPQNQDTLAWGNCFTHLDPNAGPCQLRVNWDSSGCQNGEYDSVTIPYHTTTVGPSTSTTVTGSSGSQYRLYLYHTYHETNYPNMNGITPSANSMYFTVA